MIPRVLHHIWINAADPSLPAPFSTYRDGWRALHPDWTLRLWNLDNIDFPLVRPELLPLCANYAQMADVLRLEVLHRHGGVYIDTDFEPIRPIDALLQGAEHVFCSEDGVSVSTGFLAAVPGSMLIRRCLDALPQRLGAAPPNVESGPGFITGQLLREGFDGGVRLLPSRLLYPYRMHEPERAAGPFPDAYAVHRWAHSWSPPRSLARRVAGRLRRLLEAGT